MGTPGVAEIDSFWGFLKQFEVAVDPLPPAAWALHWRPAYRPGAQQRHHRRGLNERSTTPFLLHPRSGLARTLDRHRAIVVTRLRRRAPVVRMWPRCAWDTRPLRGHDPQRRGRGSAASMMRKGENASKVSMP